MATIAEKHDAAIKALEKIQELAAPGQELGINDAIDLICDIYNEARKAAKELA